MDGCRFGVLGSEGRVQRVAAVPDELRRIFRLGETGDAPVAREGAEFTRRPGPRSKCARIVVQYFSAAAFLIRVGVASDPVARLAPAHPRLSQPKDPTQLPSGTAGNALNSPFASETPKPTPVNNFRTSVSRVRLAGVMSELRNRDTYCCPSCRAAIDHIGCAIDGPHNCLSADASRSSRSPSGNRIL